ncbi:MAG TPA: hypothetical protein VGD75_17575 [Bradyrhizobium sp.]
MAAGFKGMPVVKQANSKVSEGREFFWKARFAEMAFAPDFLSA